MAVLSLAIWSVSVLASTPNVTLPGRVQVGAFPVVGVGATTQLSTTDPVKPSVGAMVSVSETDCPGEAIESELSAAESAKPGPSVTCIGICTDWLC